MINRVAVGRDPDQDGDATSGSGCLDLCPDVGKPIVSVLHLRALAEQRIRFIEKQDRTAAFSFLEQAIETASRLIRDIGYEPVLIGGLAMGKYLMPGTPLAGEHTPEEIRKIAGGLR